MKNDIFHCLRCAGLFNLPIPTFGIGVSRMEHKTAKLFEPQASFWLSWNELSATVEGIEQKAHPGATATIEDFFIKGNNREQTTEIASEAVMIPAEFLRAAKLSRL